MFSLVPPLVYVNPSSETVSEGREARFECIVLEGIPEPTIRWIYKENMKGTNKSLVLSNLTKGSSEGNYTCIATNEDGSSSDTTILKIDGKFKCSILHTVRKKKSSTYLIPRTKLLITIHKTRLRNAVEFENSQQLAKQTRTLAHRWMDGWIDG